MKLREEKFIARAVQINSNGIIPATNFIAKRNASKKWIVEFSYFDKAGYSVKLKRGAPREFPRLNGVQIWLEKIGVNEFKVII